MTYKVSTFIILTVFAQQNQSETYQILTNKLQNANNAFYFVHSSNTKGTRLYRRNVSSNISKICLEQAIKRSIPFERHFPHISQALYSTTVIDYIKLNILLKIKCHFNCLCPLMCTTVVAFH